MKNKIELSKAHVFMSNIVSDYVKNNFEAMQVRHERLAKEDKAQLLSDLKTNKDACTEWLLGEFLNNAEFKDLGYIVESRFGDKGYNEDKNIHTTIYNINDKYIRETFKYGEYMRNHSFEFVKPIEKKITVYTYETIK